MMKEYSTILFELKDEVATIWLNRPDFQNALTEIMITELTDAFKHINKNSEIRVVVLRAKGKVFCSGMDSNWLKDISKFSYELNYQSSLALSECLYQIYVCRKPTIAVVHGEVVGVANGLLSVCDFAFAFNDTVFRMNEVKYGIVAAVVVPYVVKRIGEFNAKDIMLTGRDFKTEEAYTMQLINKVLSANEIESFLFSFVNNLRGNSPQAMTFCKNLIYDIVNNLSHDESMEYSAKTIADINASDEGQEGMNAFLKGRKPYWIKR